MGAGGGNRGEGGKRPGSGGTRDVASANVSLSSLPAELKFDVLS